MNSGCRPEAVQDLVDHLFRREAGRMVAVLTRLFGPAHLDLAEDVVHDALAKALDIWPFRGVPERPSAWLYAAARNRALDLVRRETRFKNLSGDIERSFAALSDPAQEWDATAFGDDQLKLMFVCCHPDVPEPARIALTLKTLGGFSTGEIARAFLVSESAIAQRLVRAKRAISKAGLGFEVPEDASLNTRRRSVLDSLYLMFNEGYSAYQGEDLIRADMCHESLRLAVLLGANPRTAAPEVQALIALMAFQAARLPARTDGAGDLLTLAEQDRALWDRDLITLGFTALRQAMCADSLSPYHLQAGIASAHAAAPDYQATDWRMIRGHYTMLLEQHWSPVVALNRAVATAMLDGPQAGLDELDRLGSDKALDHYHLLPATRADFYMRLGRWHQAGEWFDTALAMAPNAPERRYLERRRAAYRTDRD